ncbi:MAG: riboflavin synthase [Holophagales bacterium]|jgi:riboflavin synthase|nr:riboflavin synthase [Holophagales bacterium]
MFTGLIRHIGTLASRRPQGRGARLCVEAVPELLARAEHGASVAVMGVCLTAVSVDSKSFEADLSEETLSKTTLGNLPVGARLNLEPALRVGDPLDGHLVSGHIDSVGRLLDRANKNGLWRFAMPAELAAMIAPKGSVAVDGISLTVVEANAQSFSVALIPETAAATALKDLRCGAAVNIEADPIGRYVARFMSLGNTNERLENFIKNGWGDG